MPGTNRADRHGSHRPQVGQLLALLGMILALSLTLVACSPGLPGVSLAPTTMPSPAAAAAPLTGGGGKQIQVREVEFKLEMPTTVSAGMVTFQVTNGGTMTHSLEVQGQGMDQKLDHDLAPGETGTLQVELKPDKYQVFCPIDGHKDMGMKVDLTVHS